MTKFRITQSLSWEIEAKDEDDALYILGVLSAGSIPKRSKLMVRKINND